MENGATSIGCRRLTLLPNVLIADLNNFARYPTLSVGYLAACCREAGFPVRVFSPLSVGVRGVERERPATRLSRLAEQVNFAFALSPFDALRGAREWVGTHLVSSLSRHAGRVAAEFGREIERGRPDIVLVSSYLMYRPIVESIARKCEVLGIPVLLGGPYFAQPEVISDWISIRGLTALAAGEVESRLPEIVRSILAGDDPTRWEGIVVPDAETGFRGSIARPSRALDSIPFPDFGDFPWSRYPERIIPVLTGRGCAWGACSFCSDVTGTAGRTFRSRDADRVLDEIRAQYETFGAKLFVFTDMKLNGDLAMWRSLLERFQDAAPGGRWIASVHVNAVGESGLGAAELRQAAKAGCVRLTTGLESGSQRMLDAMKKGTRVEAVSAYLHDAKSAGISTRATMIVGHPGEAVEDVRASERFVASHRGVIERIKLCSFSRTIGTPIDRQLRKQAEVEPRILPIERPIAGSDGLHAIPGTAKVDHASSAARGRSYRRAVAALVDAVHAVNRTRLPEHAAVFEGVM